jgi:hypothetical protein
MRDYIDSISFASRARFSYAPTSEIRTRTRKMDASLNGRGDVRHLTEAIEKNEASRLPAILIGRCPWDRSQTPGAAAFGEAASIPR